MRILISTMLEDIHAIAVATSLEQRGHDVVRLHHADFPTRQRVNLEYTGATLSATMAGSALSDIDPRDFDVVWNRRHIPARSDQTVNPDDREFARRETRAASAALWQLCGPAAFWINPEPAAQRAQVKPVQLAAAQRHGLAVPPTLISNDPARVREFVQRHAGVCVYKPLSMGDWFEDGNLHMLYTSKVDVAQLPTDRLLQACPGIYQRRVDKHYEVRATFMGAQCCAIRIDSQQTERGQVDWRQAQGSERMPARPVEAPAAVQAACRALMTELGIVFGCFDFIVTPEGEWVFLEVNEAGQFLFLEVWCPELPLLDMFCQFLLSRDTAFRYRTGATPLRYPADIEAGALERINATDRAAHVDTNVWQSMTVALKAAS
ncbi:MAG: MvdC/MvdD family ATP grasp protein [Tahibacter sp.]